MKGLVRVTDSAQAHILQAVRELYDIVPGIAWNELPESQQQHNRLVVIGRNLDLDALERGFKHTVQ